MNKEIPSIIWVGLNHSAKALGVRTSVSPGRNSQDSNIKTLLCKIQTQNCNINSCLNFQPAFCPTNLKFASLHNCVKQLLTNEPICPSLALHVCGRVCNTWKWNNIVQKLQVVKLLWCRSNYIRRTQQSSNAHKQTQKQMRIQCMTKIGRENWLFPKSSRYNYLEPYSKTGSRWKEETNIKNKNIKLLKENIKLKNIYVWRVFLNSEKT